ncbi:Metallo-dependent phosphatase-like protein [Fomitopsis serialis]|uniref:Metallo-dependent phosphatase-like protein n=1 Tax=Fomitopsis serialis TaxID=139415 RepID=UPI00200879D1|nr:Metallo-dependent phosphatase-like protein [Neoantrodia serialis]KAH9915702.1 Metallo-dependent phosphatase-like protein [Neoantrodia serialis]
MRPALPAALLLPTLAAGGLVDTIERTVAGVVDCATCHSALPTFKALAALGDARFVQTIAAACTDLKIEDADVCEGAIRTQGPILAHDLRHFSLFGDTATKFCDAVFGMCDLPPVTPWRVPFPKEKPDVERVWRSRGREPVKVMHFSDVHIDREYTGFRRAPEARSIAALPLGMRTCDAPGRLADSMLDATQKFGAHARFSIFTGDVIDHAVWDVDEENVPKNMLEFTDQFAQKLSAPLFPALGAESAPTNSFPRDTTEHEITADFVFDAQMQGWSTIQHHSGSYAVLAPGMDLRVISVNTQYWYKQNFWLYDSDEHQPDPNGIIAFLRAWIIAHMPPGRGDVVRDQSAYFDQVFYGHTHADEFAIGYADYSARTAENAVSVAMIGPAMTPMSGNPAFKMYDIDPDSYEIMDVRSYYNVLSCPPDPTLTSLQRPGNSSTAPVRLCSTRTLLPPNASLSPAFWHNLTEVFYKNDTAFQTYIAHKHRGREFVRRPCVGACKNGTLCEMRTLRSDVCPQQSGPIFRIPDDHGHFSFAPELGSCEGEGIGGILRKMAARAVAKTWVLSSSSISS